MTCLLTGPGRFWVQDEPEVSWPACGFGQRWNSWDTPYVDQRTLVALLGHPLLHRVVWAFNLDRADGTMTVLSRRTESTGSLPTGTAFTGCRRAVMQPGPGTA